MHRIDGDANVTGLFDEGDPLVPRLPTQITAAWLNDVQESIIHLLTMAGETPAKGVYDQITASVKKIVCNLESDHSLSGIKTFVRKILAAPTTTNDPAIVATGNGTGYGVSGAGGGAVLATVLGAAAGSAAGGDKAGVIAASVNGYALIAAGDAGVTPVRAPVRVVPMTVAPSSAAPGDIYVHVAPGNPAKLMIYDGTSWVAVGTQT